MLPNKIRLIGATKLMALTDVWTLLRNITTVSFEANSAAQTGWNGVGTGVVTVSEPSPYVLIFEESGRWQPHHTQDLPFSNVFRWSLVAETLRLEHLRFGAQYPVFLFDLVQGKDGTWREISPHACGEDYYSGKLSIIGQQVELQWTIKGPRKNESIRYIYQ